MRRVLAENAVEIVLHAAAYKHVPIVEENPIPGFANNVLATQVLAQAALECGVERFILISSDKAVRPRNMMGASQAAGRAGGAGPRQRARTNGAKTVFSMVRFGNVLGSSGSVIPLFQDQIAKGGPVTRDPPRGHALLHDDPRGGAAGAGRRHLRRGRRGLRARHGRPDRRSTTWRGR